MTEHAGMILFKTAFWLYVASAACYIVHVIRKRSFVGKTATTLLIVGIALHTASLVCITIAIGRLPYLNLNEYLLMFSWGAAVIYATTELMTRDRSFGMFAMPIVTLLALVAYREPEIIQRSVTPALQSYWRVPHIISAVLAYSSFTIAYVAAAMYLVREKAEVKSESFWAPRLPSLKVLDRVIYRAIAFGFLMQTTLLITGAIWAQHAWGRYWGWDPKETWALITWLIYAAYLHTRITMGWRGRRSAILATIGFVVVMFTFFGVSKLLSGLHSYA